MSSWNGTAIANCLIYPLVLESPFPRRGYVMAVVRAIVTARGPCAQFAGLKYLCPDVSLICSGRVPANSSPGQ